MEIIFIFFQIVNLFYFIYPLDISLLKINYFYEEKELYYINAMNNNDGDLYIEYWGEKNDFRYFIGLNLTTGEEIIFDNNNNIKRIQATSNRIYHDSIVINNNNENNIFSMNYKYYEFINLNNGEFSQKMVNTIYEIIVISYSFRNSIIKLKNDNYLLNTILSIKIFPLTINLYLTHFKFDSNNMDNFNQIKTKSYRVNYKNSTNCFQTESSYIQCSFTSSNEISNVLSIGIFNPNDLELLNYQNLAIIDIKFFSKIFHIKDEIGAYVYFNIPDNLPNIQIKKLNNLSLENLFDFNSIILNGNGLYTFKYNTDICYSDGIKINDSKFVVILTSENLLNLLICVFDLYNNDTSLRLRYYNLDLQQINIKISVSFHALTFGNFLGISFYNSNIEYSGYTIFNFPNFKKDNNYFNNTIIEIKLIFSNSSYLYSFSEIELVNNIFSDEIEIIKIINFSDKNQSGVILKSFMTSSEISKNDILNINDQLVFEPIITGAIPGKYLLYFSPILKESNFENADYTLFYGNISQNNYEPKSFIGNTFKLIYEIECQENCKACNHKCVECKDEYPFISDNGQKCDNICDNYIYINENKKYCIEKCNSEQFIYIENEDEKYCIEKCNHEQFIYIENEDKKYCIENCDNTKYIYIKNENEKYCVENCNNNQFIYIKNENEKYCLLSCFDNKEELYLDEEEKKCYKNCSDNLNGKIYLYQNKCVSQFPQTYTSNNKEPIYEFNIKEFLIYLNRTENIKNKDIILDIIRNELSNNEEESILSKIIILDNKNILINDKDILYQITLLDHQNNNDYKNISLIELGECENKLKEHYNIDKNESLIIFKIHYYNQGLAVPRIEYEIYSSKSKHKLELDVCNDMKINIFIPVKINENCLFKYDPSSDYYNDICFTYTSEKGTDITLNDRKREFVDKNMSLCEVNCNYNGYDIINKQAQCECQIKLKMSQSSEIDINRDELFKRFFKIKEIINIISIKCIYNLFNKEGIINNIGNYIMISIIISNIVLLFIFYLKGYYNLQNRINQIISVIKIDKNPKIISQNKRKINSLKSRIKENRSDLKLINNNETINYSKKKIINFEIPILNTNNNDNVDKNKNILSKNNINYNDYELNTLSYDIALKYDKRKYIEYYFSLLRTKHIIIFTFYTSNDYNSKTIKISLFLFYFSLYYTINALFFNDSTMHKIYIDEGNYNFIYQIPQIIYSTLISSVINNIINFFSLSQKNILKLKNCKDKTSIDKIYYQLIKCLKIKFLCYFISTFILMVLFWLYLSCFCLVYKNTQIHLLKDTLISFGISLFYPFILNLIPGIFRIPSLNNNNRTIMFKLSKILQLV